MTGAMAGRRMREYTRGLQRIGGVVWYLRGHLGQRFASTAGVAPKTEAFVANIEHFVAEQGLEMVSFAKHQRKDDVTQQYLQQFDALEGVLYVGRAQEKARVVRAERQRSASTGMSYPWVVDGSAMVNHYYFYCVDSDFGPFFLKFCSYFPYNAQLCINGNEYAVHCLRSAYLPRVSAWCSGRYTGCAVVTYERGAGTFEK